MFNKPDKASCSSCFVASLFLIAGWWTDRGGEPRLISGKPQLQIVIYSVITAVSTIKLSMVLAYNQVNRKCLSDYWKIFKVSTDPAPLECQNSNDIELQACPSIFLFIFLVLISNLKVQLEGEGEWEGQVSEKPNSGKTKKFFLEIFQMIENMANKGDF